MRRRAGNKPGNEYKPTKMGGDTTMEVDPEEGVQLIRQPLVTAAVVGAPEPKVQKATGGSRKKQARRTTGSSSFLCNKKILAGVIGLALIMYVLQGGARSFLGMSALSATRKLQVSTFNVAAINNNPFEYWLTIPENPNYEDLMANIEEFIENPGAKDVLVTDVFTPAMFTQLDKRLTSVGWASMKNYWEEDFSKRKIVAGFLKEGILGKKRLASMPDRVTNSISTADGKTVFRPTVISMYEKNLDNQEMWWNAWQSFMFDEKLKIKDKNTGNVELKAPFELLQQIKKSKYPAISEQEEKDSLPLQTLCGAIFDGILVYMMNTVSQPDKWQPLKRTIVDNLNKKKETHTLEILETQYMDSDIMTLQEVSGALVDLAAKGKLGKNYHIVTPDSMDRVRDQNSVIFLSRKTFPSGSTKEITDAVRSMFPKGKDVPVANGDILAIVAKSAVGEEFVIASFHGDTNGLATIPVLDAIMDAMKSGKSTPKNAKFIFGLDANTYENGVSGQTQDVMEWGSHYVTHGLTSCWGDVPQKSNYTTYNARTYLQPQLNKACKRSEKRSKGDVNPKDFILFPKTDYKVVKTWKDNTGQRAYKEDMAFPTMQFPSDHAILTTIIEPIAE